MSEEIDAERLRAALQTVADACRTGASTNIIFGLALGYQSCIIPTIVLAVVIFVSFSLANMYGIACAALGMLGTLATGARSIGYLRARMALSLSTSSLKARQACKPSGSPCANTMPLSACQ